MSTIDTRSAPNGLDLGALDAARQAVLRRPALAGYRFRARNRWVAGAHSRSLTQPFQGALRRHAHRRSLVLEADHPPLLGGQDNGPTPAEYVLFGVAADLTATVVTVASERAIALEAVETVVEGDVDVRGMLGVAGIRPGYSGITARLTLRSDASAEALAGVLAHARARSTVLDSLAGAVPVDLIPHAGAGGATDAT